MIATRKLIQNDIYSEYIRCEVIVSATFTRFSTSYLICDRTKPCEERTRGTAHG